MIVNEEDFVVSTEPGRGESVLWIREVFPEDDGEFVCKVENDYGTAVSLCQLTVLCKHHIHISSSGCPSSGANEARCVVEISRGRQKIA